MLLKVTTMYTLIFLVNIMTYKTSYTITVDAILYTFRTFASYKWMFSTQGNFPIYISVIGIYFIFFQEYFMYVYMHIYI